MIRLYSRRDDRCALSAINASAAPEPSMQLSCLWMSFTLHASKSTSNISSSGKSDDKTARAEYWSAQEKQSSSCKSFILQTSVSWSKFDLTCDSVAPPSQCEPLLSPASRQLEAAISSMSDDVVYAFVSCVRFGYLFGIVCDDLSQLPMYLGQKNSLRRIFGHCKIM